jgi:hypothetical protein
LINAPATAGTLTTLEKENMMDAGGKIALTLVLAFVTAMGTSVYRTDHEIAKVLPNLSDNDIWAVESAAGSAKGCGVLRVDLQNPCKIAQKIEQKHWLYIPPA